MASGYPADQPNPNVNAVPAFHTEQLSASGSMVVTYANVTESITIQAQRGVMISLTATSGGDSETFFHQLRHDDDESTPSLTIYGQFKYIRLTNLDGANTNYVSTLAILSRIPSADFPDYTTANGFEKV